MTSFRTFREILIADAQLEDLDTLLAGLGSDVETWLVQPGDDAVARIFTALATPGLSKLHLLAHGMPGGIALGGKRITIGDFTGRYDGAAQRDLDIAFWSCETGAGAAGQAFVAAVAQATGARVAAAEGLVGHAERGGNWNLGPGATAPFSAIALQRFDRVLALPGNVTSDGGNPATWTLTNSVDLSSLDLSTADNGHPVGTINMGGVFGVTLMAAQAGALTFTNPSTATVLVLDAATVAQAIAAGSANQSHKVALSNGLSDTLAAYFGSTDGTTLVSGLSDLLVANGWNDYGVPVTVTDASVTIAQLTAVNTLGVNNQGAVINAIADTAANLDADALHWNNNGSTGWVHWYHNIKITDSVNVAQLSDISAAAAASGALTLSGGLSDTVTHFFGSASGTTLVGSLPALTGDSVKVSGVLSVAQAAALEAAVTGTGTLTLSGSVSDLFAGDAVNANTLTLLQSQSAPNVAITGAVDVAQAQAMAAAVSSASRTLTLSGGLADTVTHLFGSATGTTLASGLPALSGHTVTVSDVVSVAQAAALETAVTGSGTVTLSGGLADRVENLFGSVTGTTLVSGLPALTGDSVTVSGEVSVAQAVALKAAVTGSGAVTLAGGMADTAAHLFGSADGTTLVSGLPDLSSTRVTVSGTVSVAQAVALQAAAPSPILLGGLSDTVAHFFGSADGTTLVSGLPELTFQHLTVSGAVSVAQAVALETAVFSAPVVLTDGLSDTVAHLFGSATGTTLVSGLPALSGGHVTVSGAVSVAQAVALETAVTGSGTLTLSDGVLDTLAHLFGSADGVTLVGGLPDLTGSFVRVSEVASVAQAVALETAVGGAGAVLLPGLSDTVAHFFGSADGTTLVSGLPDLTYNNLTVSGAVNVAQAAALETAVYSGPVTLLDGLSDTRANLFAGDAVSADVADLLGKLSGPRVTILDKVDVAQAAAMHSVVPDLTLAGGLWDSTANFFGSNTGTTLVSALPNLAGDHVTVSSNVNVAQAVALEAAVTGTGTLTLGSNLMDSATHFFGSPSGTTLVSGLPNLTGDSVRVTDAVSVAQAVVLETAVTGSGFLVLHYSDTAAHYFGSADGTTLVGGLPTEGGHLHTGVTVTDVVNVAQAIALQTANGVDYTTALAGGVADTVTHFFGSASGTTLVGGLPNLNGEAVTVTGAASVAQLTALHAAAGSGVVSYSTVADTAAVLATLSGSTWTVNAAIKSGTNVIVSTVIGADELAAIDAANGAGTVTSLANMPGSNFYAVETAATPSWSVAGGVVANVIDAAGAQTIHIAAGGALNLSGSDGNNVIVFDNYLREQLHITSSGTTVIFSDGNGAVASIATDAVYAATQTIQFRDGSHVSLTDTGGVLAINGVTIVGSASLTLPHFVDPA